MGKVTTLLRANCDEMNVRGCRRRTKREQEGRRKKRMRRKINTGWQLVKGLKSKC